MKRRRCLCFAALALAAATSASASAATEQQQQQQVMQSPPAAAAVIEAAVAESPDLYSKFDFSAKRWPGGVPPLRDDLPEGASFSEVKYAKEPPVVKARGLGRQSVDDWGAEDEVAQAESDVGALDGEEKSFFFFRNRHLEMEKEN